jgi:iron complex outermembrane receptor protein
MKYAFTFLLILFLKALLAQQAIEGKIIDGKSKEPLAFVSIQINNSNQGTTTDINGKFSLSNPKSIELLRFSSLGYDKKVYTKKQLLEKNYIIELTANSYELEEVEVVPGINPVHRLIEAAIKNKEKNNGIKRKKLCGLF